MLARCRSPTVHIFAGPLLLRCSAGLACHISVTGMYIQTSEGFAHLQPNTFYSLELFGILLSARFVGFTTPNPSGIHRVSVPTRFTCPMCRFGFTRSSGIALSVQSSLSRVPDISRLPPRCVPRRHGESAISHPFVCASESFTLCSHDTSRATFMTSSTVVQTHYWQWFRGTISVNGGDTVRTVCSTL